MNDFNHLENNFESRFLRFSKFLRLLRLLNNFENDDGFWSILQTIYNKFE